MGVGILYDAGYDPRGMAQFFEVIQAKSGAGGAQFMSDHPNPGNRTEYVTKEVATFVAPRTPVEEAVARAWADPAYRARLLKDATPTIGELGYAGGYTAVKELLREIRPSQPAGFEVRFETPPGRQAQVDFAEFAVELPDGSVKKYFLFSLILGYSRMLYGELLERCDMTSFLEAHIRAFEALGGVPFEILYDRMRNVFLLSLIHF